MEAGQTSNAPSGGGNSSDFVCALEYVMFYDALADTNTCSRCANFTSESRCFLPSPFSSFFSSPPPPPLLHCAACILVSDYSIQGYYHGSIIRFFSNWLFLDRMLEDPSYSEIVRWGDEGDSFVVLEVMRAPPPPPFSSAAWNLRLTIPSQTFLTVRKIHQDYPPKAFQAQ